MVSKRLAAFKISFQMNFVFARMTEAQNRCCASILEAGMSTKVLFVLSLIWLAFLSKLLYLSIRINNEDSPTHPFRFTPHRAFPYFGLICTKKFDRVKELNNRRVLF